MGAQYSLEYNYPSFEPGSVTVVVESDECCTMEPCTGRTFDRNLPKPDFVHLSDASWRNFVGEMHANVRSYKPESWALPILLLIPIGAILNNSVKSCNEDGEDCVRVLPFGSMGFIFVSVMLFFFGAPRHAAV